MTRIQQVTMFPQLILAVAINQFWYSLPLLVSISLVYAATRHEYMRPILEHAARTAVWIAGFMLVVFVLIYWMSRGL